MKESFRKHAFILLPAVVIGLIIFAPTLLAIVNLGTDFKGVYPMLSNDEDQYLTMTKEVYDGHLNLSSPYLKEHKDASALQQPLAEIFFATEAKALNISVPKLFTLNDLFLPLIGVILLYFLFFDVTGSRIVAGLSSTLYYFLFISEFNRPINPQFSFLFLFLGLFIIWKIVENEDKNIKKLLILNLLLAIDFGLAFYIYPFVWSSIFVVYCLSLFILAAKEREWRYYLKNFLTFIIPASVSTIPFILNIRKAAIDINYMDANLRFGFIFNHWPGAYLNVTIMFFCMIILYVAGLRFGSKREIFAYSLAISGVLLNWQNVITGKAFSFSMHYYWVVVLFLFLIFSICALEFWKGHKKNRLDKKNVLAIFLMLVAMAGLFYKERGLNFFSIIESVDIENFRDIQNLADVADWFNVNSPRDSAVYTLGKDYKWFIPIYTYDNDFQNSNAGVFLVSDGELEDRWVIQNFFNKNINADYITKYDVDIWTNKFIERYQSEKNRRKILSFIIRQNYIEPEFIPKEYIDRVLAKVDLYRKLGFEKSLKQYSVDYILINKNDPEYGYLADDFKKAKYLSFESEIGNSLIFKVK